MPWDLAIPRELGAAMPWDLAIPREREGEPCRVIWQSLREREGSAMPGNLAIPPGA